MNEDINDLEDVNDEAESPSESKDEKDAGREFSIETFRKRYALARIQRSKQLKVSHACQEFVSGHQWSDEDTRAMDDDDRPRVTYNRIENYVDAATGASDELNLEAKFRPRTVSKDTMTPHQDDVGIVEVINKTNKYFRDQCGAQDEEIDASTDMFIGGIGYVKTWIDFDDDPDGRIVIERLDPDLVMYDPAARKRNIVDAEFMFETEFLSAEAIDERWPGKRKDIVANARDSDAAGSIASSKHVADIDEYLEDRGNASDQRMILLGRFPVVCYYWWQRERYMLWADPNSADPQELSIEDHAEKSQGTANLLNELNSRMEQHQAEIDQYAAMPPMPQMDPSGMTMMVQPQRPPEREAEYQALMQQHESVSRESEALSNATELVRKVYYQAFLCGDELLESPERIGPVGGFPIKAKTGKWDRKRKVWRGIVENMMDPQRFANKGLSAVMDILTSHPKGGFFYEESAVDDEEEFKDTINRHDTPTKLADGGLPKIQPKTPPPQIPQLSELLNFSVGSIQEVSPINPVMLGKGGASTPGVTAAAYKKQAFGLLSKFFQSERVYRREHAKYMLCMISLIPATTIARIVDSSDYQFIENAQKRMYQQFDVVIEEAQTSPSVQQDVMQSMQFLLPTLKEMGAPPQVLIPLLPYLPIPVSMRQELQAIFAAPPPGSTVGAPGPQLPNQPRQPVSPNIPHGQNGAPIQTAKSGGPAPMPNTPPAPGGS